MSKRTGPFWDALEGRSPLPRAAATPGLERGTEPASREGERS
jgi:hypothetical protein